MDAPATDPLRTACSNSRVKLIHSLTTNYIGQMLLWQQEMASILKLKARNTPSRRSAVGQFLFVGRLSFLSVFRTICWSWSSTAFFQPIRHVELASELVGQSGHLIILTPLSTSRNQVLVQSQCYCRFLVGSTGEPFKNRLLLHRLESQYRSRSYVTEYVSLAWPRQRQT